MLTLVCVITRAREKSTSVQTYLFIYPQSKRKRYELSCGSYGVIVNKSISARRARYAYTHCTDSEWAWDVVIVITKACNWTHSGTFSNRLFSFLLSIVTDGNSKEAKCDNCSSNAVFVARSPAAGRHCGRPSEASHYDRAQFHRWGKFHFVIILFTHNQKSYLQSRSFYFWYLTGQGTLVNLSDNSM